MSAVSKNVTPASRAASTTARVPSTSRRPPKLLQPSPTTETSGPALPRLRVRRAVIRPTLCGGDPLQRGVPLREGEELELRGHDALRELAEVVDPADVPDQSDLLPAAEVADAEG